MGTLPLCTVALLTLVLSASAQIFNCTDDIAGKRYLLADLTVVCYEGGHLAMLLVACAAALVYAAGIPATVAFATAMKTPVVCRGRPDPATGARPWTSPRCVCERRAQAKYAAVDVRTRIGFLFLVPLAVLFF